MKILPFILLFCLPFTLWAQEGNVTAGGEYSGFGGSMSNSTGQTDFITLYSANVSIQYGLQQVFFETSGIPTDNILQNFVFAEDANECFNAAQTITTAGDGTTFIIENQAEVELIAGQNIIMLPGTHAQLGGYLHASITTNGFYCNGRQPVVETVPIVKNREGDLPVQQLMTSDEKDNAVHGKASFKVYPNPTPGLFTLELTDFNIREKTAVTIYGIRGERIQQEEVSGNKFTVFSLENQLSGIYLIRVLSNHLIGTKCIIRQ
jgi:hypothetical protein